MIISGFALSLSAAFIALVGMLGGWLLRGLLLARSTGSDCRTLPVAQQYTVSAGIVDEATDGETSTPCVRKTFALALGHRLAESRRRGDPLSLILARIDSYEKLAELHDMQASNEILEAVGKFFIASVRGMDWVARFDAATFAFLLPNTPHTGALQVAERLRTTTSAASPKMGAAEVSFTLSIGTTEFMLGDSGEAILRRAEDAMNASVRSGGNCIRSYVVGQFETAEVA
jgi:diguanylate cyclase (GGDEF)-like protein